MRANRLQLLLGIEGLALLRLWLAGAEAQVEARIEDVARLMGATSRARAKLPTAHAPAGRGCSVLPCRPRQG